MDICSFLLHNSGRLQKGVWSTTLSNDAMRTASSSSFLNIYKIYVQKEHRGNDLAFRCIKHLFDSLAGRCSLNVLDMTFFKSLKRDCRFVNYFLV